MKTVPPSFLAVALAIFSPSLHAQTWDGGAGGGAWSNGANWVGELPPANDGTAQITLAGNVGLTSTVDTPWSIQALNFAAGAGAFILGGSALTIGDGGIVVNASLTQTVNAPLLLEASQVWGGGVSGSSSGGKLLIGGTVANDGHTLTLYGISGDSFQNAFSTISGAISGAGGLIKAGPATWVLSGTAANTYTGTTSVNEGVLRLNKSAEDGAIAGDLVIGQAAGGQVTVLYGTAPFDARPNQIANTATVTVNASGVLDLKDAAETLARLILDGGRVDGAKNLALLNDLTMAGGYITGSSSGGGNLSLGGNLNTLPTANVAQIAFLPVNLLGGDRTFHVSDGAAATDLEVSGNIFNGGITKTGAGTLALGQATRFRTG